MIESGTESGRAAGYLRLRRDLLQELPDVPVLPETALLLETKAREPQGHPREIAQLVASDLGATLQLFRTLADWRRSRIRAASVEECVAELGARGCAEAIAHREERFCKDQRMFAETWVHARKIATYCQLMTEDFTPGLAPQEAYLVGLFHELGALPAVLGWSRPVLGQGEMAAAGLRIAAEWALPVCIQEYFCELQAPSMLRRWQPLVHAAHELASMPQIETCLRAGMSVQAPARA